MDNDPKSYRVPILHLSDVIGDDDAPKEEQTALAGSSSSTPQAKPALPATPKTTPTGVIEEDVASAIITPKGQQPIVQPDPVEEKKKETTPPPKIEIEAVVPVLPEVPSTETTLKATTEEERLPTPTVPRAQEQSAGGSREAFTLEPELDTLDIAEEKIPETTKVDTSTLVSETRDLDSVISVQPETQVEEKLAVETEQKTENILEETEEPFLPQELDTVETEEGSSQELEKFEQVEKNEVPLQIPEAKPQSIQHEEGDDIADLFSLVEKKVSAEPTPDPELYAEETPFDEFEESNQTPAKAYTYKPRIPAPEPLDIWEQDAAKPRTPYKPIKRPQVPVENTKEVPVPENDLQTLPQSEAPPTVLIPPEPTVTPAETPLEVPTLTQNPLAMEEPVAIELPAESKDGSAPEVTPLKASDPIIKESVKENDAPKVIKIHTESKNKSTHSKEALFTEEPVRAEVPTEIEEKPTDEITPVETIIPVKEHLKKEKKIQIQEEDSKPLADTTPSEEPSAPTPSTGGVSNLSALRERARKENENKAGEETTAKLDGVEKEDGVAHSAETSLDASDAKPQDTGTSPKNRPRPTSKHAQIIADVADRLHNMDSNFEAKMKENAEKAEMIQPEEKPETPTPKKVVPGALEVDVPKPSFKPVESAVPMIRTFRQDVEQAVTRDRTSVVDMISAEEKRRGGETIRLAQHPTESSWSYVFIGASMMLVISAFAIGAFLFFRVITKEPSETVAERIPVNETISYDITAQTKDELMGGLLNLRNSLHTNLGAITKIQLTERRNEEEGSSAKKTFVTASAFLKQIESHAPGSFVRSVSDSMLLGVHELTQNEPFFVFTPTQYDVAFKAMFEWESTLQGDLSPLFGVVPQTALPASTQAVTATTSSATSSDSTTETRAELPSTAREAPREFEDIVVANTQARALRNTTGDIVLVWTMPDESAILITTNETTMRTLLERMTARAY